MTATATSASPSTAPPTRRHRAWWRISRWTLLAIIVLVSVARWYLPSIVRWEVGRIIDSNPVYTGTIGDVHIHLWRGAYSIDEIQLTKTTGSLPVPFFAAKRLDLAVEWKALLHGKVVATVTMEEPQINFVDSESESESQTGSSGAWLSMLSELFPFQINSAMIRDGSVHFRTFDRNPQVDVHLDQVNVSVNDLSNVKNSLTPLLASVDVSAVAMGSGQLQAQIRLDPNSYHPSFRLAMKLVGLDVTQLNTLTQAYGQFDFSEGYFDLVVEADAKQGQIEGYVKPLFRNLAILDLRDVRKDNPLQLFWEALLGATAAGLQNQPRQQLGTLIPFSGSYTSPSPDILDTIGNVLRNAFVRAYLPQLTGDSEPAQDIQFGPASMQDPGQSVPQP